MKVEWLQDFPDVSVNCRRCGAYRDDGQLTWHCGYCERCKQVLIQRYEVATLFWVKRWIVRLFERLNRNRVQA